MEEKTAEYPGYTLELQILERDLPRLSSFSFLSTRSIFLRFHLITRSKLAKKRILFTMPTMSDVVKWACQSETFLLEDVKYGARI